MSSSRELEKKYLKFLMETQKPPDTQSKPEQNKSTGGITTTDFKLPYRAAVIKTAWQSHTSVHITSGQKDQIKDHTSTTTKFLTKVPKIYVREKTASSTNDARKPDSHV